MSFQVAFWNASADPGRAKTTPAATCYRGSWHEVLTAAPAAERPRRRRGGAGRRRNQGGVRVDELGGHGVAADGGRRGCDVRQAGGRSRGRARPTRLVGGAVAGAAGRGLLSRVGRRRGRPARRAPVAGGTP